jgi:hypothetical protein
MTWSDPCFCRCRHESGNLARSVVGERTNCSVRGAFSWWMPHVGASWSNKPIKETGRAQAVRRAEDPPSSTQA